MNYLLTNNTNYPTISEELIKCLNIDFPDKLPTTKISEFELGVLLGQRKVIDKLIYEKKCSDKEFDEEE